MEKQTESFGLNQIMPSFKLQDAVSGNILSSDDITGSKATILFFICNHCPYVRHILPKLTEISAKWQNESFQFVALSANDVDAYPEDSPAEMKKLAASFNWNFPYLYDQTQEIFRLFKIACTPEVIVFSGENRCIYTGRFDDSRISSPATGEDLLAVLNAVNSNNQVLDKQLPSIGCSVKWRET